MSFNSKDLCLIVLLAAIQFIYVLFIGQLGSLFSGLPGLDYLFSIGHAIFISFAFLAFNGRRWRFFLYATIFTFLVSTTYYGGGAPFDFLRRTPIIINCFFADLLFNSFYGYFEKRNKKYWWSFLATTTVVISSPLYNILILSLFYTPEIVSLFITITTSLVPVFIIESIAGSYLGINIYKRTQKLLHNK